MRSKETELIASFSASLKRSERGVAVRVKAARARKAAESPGCWTGSPALHCLLRTAAGSARLS